MKWSGVARGRKWVNPGLIGLFPTDIKERFTNCILLLIVCLRNMEQFSWNPGNKVKAAMLEVMWRMTLNCLLLLFLDHLWVLFPDVVMVLTSEIAVDVVKHAFITKFNDISADVSPLLIRVGALRSKGQIGLPFEVSMSHPAFSETLSVIRRRFLLVIVAGFRIVVALFHCLSDSAVVDACVTVQVYGEYKASLAFDLVSSRQKNVSETGLERTPRLQWLHYKKTPF